MRHALLLVGGVAALAAGAGSGVYWREHTMKERTTVAPAKPVRRPTLYCDFYNVMRSATVASFYFDVDPGKSGDVPRYSELYVVENEGQKTDFGGPGQPPTPLWSYALDDGTPTISSPDGETRIILYGLKPQLGGVFWVEAGVRSNTYRNLEGKCRQAHYAAAQTQYQKRGRVRPA